MSVSAIIHDFIMYLLARMLVQRALLLCMLPIQLVTPFPSMKVQPSACGAGIPADAERNRHGAPPAALRGARALSASAQGGCCNAQRSTLDLAIKRTSS